MKKRSLFLALCLISIGILLSLSCSISPEKAKEKIQKMGMDYDEQTFLSEIQNKNIEVVKLFLISGMNPDLRDSVLGTPLFWASKENDTAMVKLLLDYNAQIDFRDTEYNATPLMCAIVFKSFDVANLLIEKGADIKAVDNNQTSVLGYSLLTKDSTIINKLLDLGLDINSSSGKEPIINCAVRTYNPVIVELILDREANPNVKSENGISPLFLAVTDTMCDTTIMKLLIEAGASIEDSIVVEGFAVDLLLTAAFSKRPDKAYFLIQNGAKAIENGIVNKIKIKNILGSKFDEDKMTINQCEIIVFKREPYISFVFESYWDNSVPIACSDDMFLLKEASIKLKVGDSKNLTDMIELMCLMIFGKDDTPQLKDWLASVLAEFSQSKSEIERDRRRVNLFNSETIDAFNAKYEKTKTVENYTVTCCPNFLSEDLLTDISFERINN